MPDESCVVHPRCPLLSCRQQKKWDDCTLFNSASCAGLEVDMGVRDHEPAKAKVVRVSASLESSERLYIEDTRTQTHNSKHRMMRVFRIVAGRYPLTNSPVVVRDSTGGVHQLVAIILN